MRNPRRPLAYVVFGSIMVAATGFLVTALAVKDWRTQFDGADYTLASESMRLALRCIEHPLERILVQRFHFDDLTSESIETVHPEIRANEDSGSALRQHDDVLEQGVIYRARVTGYTLFSLPVARVLVTGPAFGTLGGCRRM